VKRLPLIFLVIGGALFAGGASMRVYATVSMAATERRLLAARPASPADIVSMSSAFTPAEGPPTEIRLPDLGLWNALEPVTEKISWSSGKVETAWDVADAGWHVPSGWPGWGGNVVIAGHSPSHDLRTWSRSVFRQLAYLSAGDRIEVTAGGRRYLYAVTRVFAIPEDEANTPQAAAWIERGDSERLTLITCWPPHTAAYRIIVVAISVGEKS
jgi:LPXTG-site transpeptidase (sortase) family protein